MLLLAARDDLAGSDVEGREEIQRAVANVIVRLALGLAEVHRQDRLRTLERLNLRLLIDGEHDSVGRRVHVQPDDIAHLRHELRIGRELERAGQMRLEAERSPDPTDHRVAEPGFRRHRPGAPVRLPVRLRLERFHDHRLDFLVADRPRPTHARLVVQPVEPVLDEAPSPLTDGLARRAVPLRDRLVRRLVRAREHEPRAERQVAIHTCSLGQPDQLDPLGRGDCQRRLRPPDVRHAPEDHGRRAIASDSVSRGLAFGARGAWVAIGILTRSKRRWTAAQHQ
jgi:hypothetical protein